MSDIEIKTHANGLTYAIVPDDFGKDEKEVRKLLQDVHFVFFVNLDDSVTCASRIANSLWMLGYMEDNQDRTSYVRNAVTILASGYFHFTYEKLYYEATFGLESKWGSQAYDLRFVDDKHNAKDVEERFVGVTHVHVSDSSKQITYVWVERLVDRCMSAIALSK